MKFFNLILLTLILCCTSFTDGYAFFDKDVHLLTMQNGLADNTVSCIFKDRDGFMWFGTTNGLSRYDGKVIQNFTSSKSYMNVTEINELSGHTLGVVAGGTFYCFDRYAESFIPIVDAIKGESIQASRFLPIDSTSLWVLSANKLTLYTIKPLQQKKMSTTIELLPTKEYSQLLMNRESFRAFCYSSDRKTIYLFTNLGNLLVLFPGSSKPHKTIQLNNGHFMDITSVMHDKGVLWISTIGQGIVRYHLSSGKTDRINYGGKTKENMLSHTDAFSVVPISNNRYLAATWSGYTLLIPDKDNPEELTTEIYNNTVSQIHRNLETRMISAYYDPTGIVWIGTSGGGVMYSDLRSQFYSQFHQERHNEICGIALDSSRRVWLATFHQGIMRSDEPFNPSKRLRFSSVGTESVRMRKTVLCSVKAMNGNLWFGNSDGTLTSYDEKTDRFNVHSLLVNGESTPNVGSVWSLHIDRKNRFWVGTENGLFLFDPRNHKCRRINLKPYLKKESTLFIRAIAETKDGSIWLGTTSYGVCRVHFHKNGEISVKADYREPTGSVRSLLASSDGNLYIGYMDGFAILSPSKDTIRAFYTTHNGLCSNFIGCIIEDRKGHIWLGSNSGMSRYSRHQHLFYNYYIAGSNRSAFLYDKTLFWGNNKSLTYFNPDDVDGFLPNERVLITGLEVDDHPVGIGEEINGQTILTDGIPYTSSITLNNDNRDFALAFNNLSYSEEQQKYNYRLLPYQENWLISNEGEKASYTNLAEGDYTFEVKNIYLDGRSGEVTRLKITILPHWSRTVLFRLLVFVLLLGVVAYLLRWVKLRQRRLEHEMQMKHELLTVSLEREKEKQIRMERENFFTGAAHELRTPLTLILSPLQELLQQLPPSEPVYAKLLTMYKNGSSLHTLVDHLLYVQKIEAGMITLQLSEVDMTGLLQEVCESFNQMAETRNIQFNVSLPPKPVKLWVDVPKITSAIRNLLSNAFKYTPSKGSVSLSAVRILKDGNYYCQITVADTGEGIPNESQERIFDSFITGKNSPAFSSKIGIGLRIVKNTMDLHHGLITLQSTSGQGTVFSLVIPEGKAHFAGDAYESVDHRLHETAYKDEHLLSSPVIEPAQAVGKMKKTLLLIEDNVDMRQYIASLFCSNYAIIEAADGEEGVRMATDKLPDLIISDVMMPIKDGFACCREIRQQQETAHIPILMLTAKAEDVDVLEGSHSGADDYMMKPFNPEILKAKVENLILLREQLKRIYTKALMLKQEPTHDKAGDEFMQKVVNVIEANLSDEGFSVKVLAEQLNMSQPTLYRKVKKHSDLAVIDMIRSVRVSKAASLIIENRYSIQEISEMVGFTDARTLRKHFTEQFGVSPSKYLGDR